MRTVGASTLALRGWRAAIDREAEDGTVRPSCVRATEDAPVRDSCNLAPRGGGTGRWGGWGLAGLFMVASLTCLGAATGFRMVGDQWPVVGDQKRQGLPTTIQEAFEDYEIDPELVTKFMSMSDVDKGIHCGESL